MKAEQTPVYLGFYALYLHDEDFQLLGLNKNKGENQPVQTDCMSQFVLQLPSSDFCHLHQPGPYRLQTHS